LTHCAFVTFVVLVCFPHGFASAKPYDTNAVPITTATAINFFIVIS
jgi:hypothetical protein